MKRFILFISFIILFNTSGFSQDLHLSQFYMSPLTLNPALTGIFNGNYRFTANYRDQWASVIANPYRTIAAAAELSGKSGEYNRIGVGLSVISDKAGSLSLNTTSFTGSVAYTLGLSRNQDYYISTGLEVSYTQRSLNSFNALFGDQIVTGMSNDHIGTNSFSYVDAGAGILWYHIAKRKKSNQFIGFSVFHVNQPNVSFLEDGISDKLYTKLVVHAGLEFRVADKLALTPYLLATLQGPAFETEVGTLFKFILDEDRNARLGGTNFYVGAFYRIVGDQTLPVSSDALILATKLDVGGFTFGISYDVNLSGLTTVSSGRGGPELAIQYTGLLKGGARHLNCPRF